MIPLFERYRKAYVLLVQLMDEGRTASREAVTNLKPRALFPRGAATSSTECSDVGESDTDGFDTVTQLDEDTGSTRGERKGKNMQLR